MTRALLAVNFFLCIEHERAGAAFCVASDTGLTARARAYRLSSHYPGDVIGSGLKPCRVSKKRASTTTYNYRGGPERVTTKRRLAKPTPEPQPCTASPWSCDSASAVFPSFKPHSKRVTRWLTVVAGVLQSTLLACAAGAATLCSVLQKPTMMSQRCLLQPA